MKLVIYIFLFFSSFRAVGSQCSAVGRSSLIAETLQCSFLNVAASENGGTSSVIKDGSVINTAHLIDGDIVNDALDKNDNSNSEVNISFSRSYIVNTIRITEWEDGTESEIITLQFSDGSMEEVILSSGFKGPEELSFTPRETLWVKLVEKTKYEEGLTLFTEIELYYDGCQKDKICHYVELDTQERASALFLFGQTFSFMRNTANEMYLKFYFNDKNVMYMQLSLTGEVSLLDSTSSVVAGPNTIPGGISHWVPFWIDFTNVGHIIVGAGTTEFFDYDTGISETPAYGKFVLQSSSSEKLVYCQQKASCFENASHYWPLDKLVSNMAYDMISQTYASSYGAVTMNLDGPPLSNGKRTSILLQDDYIDLDYSTTCINNLDLCLNGFSFSVWLQIESLQQTTRYYLAGGTSTAGFAIISPAPEERMVSDNELEIEFQNSVRQWRISVSLTVKEWHYIGCSWHPEEGLICLINIKTVLKGTEGTPASSFGPFMLGMSFTVPNSFVHASFSDLAVWDKRLTTSDFQSLYYCSGMKPYPEANNSLGIGSYKLPDESFSASTYTEDGAPYLARNELGGWISKLSDDHQFLQIDFFALVEIHSLEIKGNSAENAFVKTFTLSKSQNGLTWDTYQGDDGKTKVFEGNSQSGNKKKINLDNHVITRYLRINVVTYNEMISMKLEIFGNEKHAKYVGCLPAATAITSEVILASLSDPFDCMAICSKQNKPYALLYRGGACYCSDFADKTTAVVNDLFCKVPCKKAKMLSCGGQNHVAAFDVKEFDILFQVFAPEWTLESSNINITSSDSPSFQVYSENIVTQTQLSYLPLSFSGNGFKSLVFEATIGQYKPETIQVQHSIFVASKAKRLSLTCPRLVVVPQSYECVLEGYASKFDVFQYSIDGSFIASPTLPAGFVGNIGGRSDALVKVDDIQSGVLFISSFVESAILTAIELHAQKSGYLNIQIYRPFCGTGPYREYCDINKICTYFNPVCNEISSYTCPTDQLLHLPTGQCLVKDSSNCIGNSRMPQFISQKYQRYELVYDIRVFVKYGVNIFKQGDKEVVNVYENDVIGVSYPNESAASLSVESGNGYEIYVNVPRSAELVGGDYIEVSENQKVVHLRHSLKAKYFLPQKMTFTITLSPGVHHATAVFDNAVSHFESSQQIIAGVPLKDLSSIVQDIIATHDELVISVTAIAGTNITFNVIYGDGHVEEVFQQDAVSPVSFTHVYTSAGYKSLELHVSNYFTEELTHYTLLVQDYIKDVNLTTLVLPTKFTHATAIDWYIDSGSRVTIKIDLGDGTRFSNESLDIQGVLARPIRHVYPKPIEYWVNITAYNLVNRIQLYFMVIVEIPIVNITSLVVHANRDIEVNETVSIELHQLNGTNVIHHFQFQDTSTLLTRDIKIFKNYSYWFVFLVNITAWNNVTSVTWIQPIKVHKPVRELTGFVITTSPTNHTDPVKFDFKMETGSDFNCTWDFDDNLYGKTDYWILHSEVYIWPITQQVVYHKYAGIGVYIVRINCTNRLYETSAFTISVVQVPISKFNVDPLPPQPNDEDLVVDFRAATGTNISYVVTFYHIWERQPIEITNVNITKDTLNGRAIISKEYFMNRVGFYDVKITAINLVTPLQVITRRVIVDRPIRNAHIVIHALYVQTNRTVNYTIYTDASNVTITWDMNDPDAGDLNVRQNWFQGVYSVDGWTIYHIFKHSGFRTVIVKLTNSLGSVTVSKEIIGQYGVYLRTSTDSPRPLPPGRMNFTFTPLPRQYHPTDAQMIMYFGDGTNYTGPYNSTVIHFYESWGIFKANCSMWNEIDWGYFEFEVEIQRIISGLKLTPFHSAGDAGFWGPARGDDYNRLPFEYDVIWNVTFDDGTNITYTYNFGDGEGEITTNFTVFHKYPKVDYFTAYVLAENAVSSGTTSFKIRIQQIVRGLDINSDCPNKLGNPTTFRITIDQVGTESCYLLKFGNNSQNFLFKNAENTICEQGFVDLADKTEVFSGNTFNVTYTYGFIDVYWPRFIGSNLVSKTWKFHKSVVLHDTCRYPDVNVFNIGRNTSLAPKIFRAKLFFVDTQNKITCEASKTTSFLWEVSSVNLAEGENDTLETMPPTTSISNPRFRIDPRLLPYGLYKMRFSITMLGIDGVVGFDDAFLEIVESPMIATIAGGSGLAKGFQQNVTLDASGSQDPDVGPEIYENITITWECRAVTAPAGTTAEQAGCGVDEKTVLKNGSAADLVKLNTTFTKLPNVLYCLKLTLDKNGRRVLTYFNIYTEPVELLPVFVKCLQNCKKKRITAVKMAYTGGIKDLNDPETLKRVKYEWKLRAAPEIGALKRINEKKWEEVSEFASEMVATTADTATVVISEKMLWPISRYRLGLYVTLDEMEGFAEEEFFMNQPPNGGECTINPEEGYALETDFVVTCSGWKDNDMPLSYKFAYKKSEDDFESLIYFGSKSETPPIKLPLGKASLNYSVLVIVDAADSYLAANISTLNVTVIPKPVVNQDEFENKMKNMISTNGSLGNMMASGDAHSAAQLTGSLSSILDDQASKTDDATDELLEEEEIDIEAMTPEEQEELLKKRLEKKRQKEEEKIRKQEKEKQARIEMRKMMESTLATIPIDSVEAIREKAAASAMISNTPGEVTADMQDSTMNSAMEMIAFLGNSTVSDEPPNPQDSFNAAGGLMSTLGNAMEASIESGAAYNNSDADGETNSTKSQSASKDLVNKALENVENLAIAVLNQKFAGEPPTEVKTERLSMAVERTHPSSFGKKPATTGGGGFLMPDAGSLFGIEGNDTSGMPAVDTKAVSNTKNPFAWDPSGAAIKSKVMTMEMKNASGYPIKISNLSKPIDIWVPRSSYVNFTLYTMTYGVMLYRAFTVVKNDTSIQIEILPEDNNTELIAYLRFGKFPKEDLYDHKFLVPKREFIDESANGTKSNKTKTREINPYIFFISNQNLNRTAAGKYYVGIKYNGTFKPVYEAKMSGTKVLYTKYIPININLTMRTFTSSCLYWNTDNETWSTEGCTVGSMTVMEGTQCFCTHLTSFGGDMVVAPNTIDWSAISLDNLFSNPIVFAVVVSFILLYFLLLIPARRQDKKDLEKLGVVPLPDNDPRDCYSYEITVYTGFSAEAGSTADIYFILKGSRDETPVRLLKDPGKEKFSVGSIKYFLLTVPSSLGKLKSIRIWHNNGGSSPSWYLSRLMIHDIQKDSKTWFLCDRWLAVEEDDGEIERNLRPASGEDLTKFNLLFQIEARKNLSDGHIWFSVIKRPARSNFTRVQRLSCCLCILLTTMLANAMFYQNDPSSSGAGVLKVGPISFSLQQLSIAITSSLVVLPVNLFVVWIFRTARPYKKSQDRNETGGKSSEKKGEGVKKKTSLPHWMVYVAYSLICLACLVSGTFTVFYGLTFGKAKSEAWISAMMLSFWQDVLVSQPLKVFAAATLFALLTKDPKKATGENEEDTQMSPELRQDEEFVPRRTFAADEAGLMSMTRIDPKPLDPQKLQACRELRLKQKQMKLIIYDIIWYFLFVIVLLSVAHGNKDPMAYQTTSTMSNFFEENSYTDWVSLSEVTDPRLYWYWSRHSLIPTLIPNQWYGPNMFLENVVWTKADSEISRSRGARSRLRLSQSKQRKLQGRPGDFPDMAFALNDSKEYPSSFIADRATHYTVGVARYRQLRVQQNRCKVLPIFQHIFSECNSFYSWEKEDEGNYYAGWVPENITTTNKTIDEELTSKQKNAWQYNTAWELKGTPYWAGFSTYWGGGFVADLGHNESLAMNMTAFLQKFNWLDRYTRAIFIEFTVYNPNTNFFCLVTLLTEIIPTGGYYQFNQIYPVRLYRYYGPNLLAIMVLEITLMTFLLYFAYREFKKWRREGRLYWKQPWNYMELLVLASCFSTIGLYFARMVATNYSIGLMRDDPTRFVSFHYAAALDEWSTFTLGMAVFLSFLKTLRLLRFNRRMSFMSKTLKICIKPLASFFIVYLVVFLAYATFGFLVFGKVAYDYNTFQSSMANVLGMTLGAFNFYALVEAHSILGPTFFVTFTFVVNFILINVFVAIISEALATVTSDAAHQSNDHEMLDFMVHQFKSFIGQRVSPAIKPVYKEPLSELDENLEQIQKKGESLEVALRNMCMEEIRHTSWLDPEKCPKKKKLLMQLLINLDEEITEYDICDAIPLLEEVLATYTEKDIKEWLGEYTEFDESESCRSSCLFTRTSMHDSDEDSEDEDRDSENESLREGRWSELSGETAIIPPFAERKFFSEDASEGGEAKSGGMDDYLYNRPPSTAERFCHTATTISMTSLNENADMVNQIIGDDDCERLFIEDSEGEEGEQHWKEEEEKREVENNLAKEESEEEREEEERENEEMDPITAWMVNSKAATMTSRPPVDARQETSKQLLFQQAYSPRNVKHGEEISIEEFSDD